MVKSMTGFGRAEQQNTTHICKAEIRSVNNRFLEINTRLPKTFQDLEQPIKKLVKSACYRGSFDLTLSLEETQADAGSQTLKPNLPLAGQYVRAFHEIRDTFGLSGELDINTLAGFRDIIKVEPQPIDPSVESLVEKTVSEALQGLIRMREEEGKHLSLDINERIKKIESETFKIIDRQADAVNAYKDRLHEKIRDLTDNIELDESRLAQEVAIMADRSDVTEETTRLASHLNQFETLIKTSGPIGRKLEFLTQEINRETNTIGSKTVNDEVSRSVIDIKSELEKIREQLQNIE